MSAFLSIEQLNAQLPADLQEAIRRNESRENLFEVASRHYTPAVVAMLTGAQEGCGGPVMGMVAQTPEGRITIVNAFVTMYINADGKHTHEYKSMDDLLATPVACLSRVLQMALEMGASRPWMADGHPREFPPVLYFATASGSANV